MTNKQMERQRLRLKFPLVSPEENYGNKQKLEIILKLSKLFLFGIRKSMH